MKSNLTQHPRDRVLIALSLACAALLSCERDNPQTPEQAAFILADAAVQRLYGSEAEIVWVDSPDRDPSRLCGYFRENRTGFATGGFIVWQGRYADMTHDPREFYKEKSDLCDWPTREVGGVP